MNPTELQPILREIDRHPPRQLPLLDPGLQLWCGTETRRTRAAYEWHGLRRGGDPAHPYVVFQYTLSGHGCFEIAGRVEPIGPGKAFSAVVPSAHAYYADDDAGPWTFFYVLVRHEYVVRRMTAVVASAGAVMSAAPDSRLLAAAVGLYRDARDAAADRFSREARLFEFLIEYERQAEQSLYPRSDRERILDDTRRFVRKNLKAPIDVAALGERLGMGRSNFSHHFKARTGLTPAAFVTELRLEEVKRRLAQTDETLKRIADETGFADANHLCKVFRRHHHMSPGIYRRMAYRP